MERKLFLTVRRKDLHCITASTDIELVNLKKFLEVLKNCGLCISSLDEVAPNSEIVIFECNESFLFAQEYWKLMSKKE